MAPRVNNRRWDTGFKVDLPEFHGGLESEELLEWISATEEILAFKQVPDDVCVALVVTRSKVVPPRGGNSSKIRGLELGKVVSNHGKSLNASFERLSYPIIMCVLCTQNFRTCVKEANQLTTMLLNSFHLRQEYNPPKQRISWSRVL